MIITDDLCCILGMDVGGQCLRHPAIMIMSSSGGKNVVGYNLTSFCSCKICHSELEAGGSVQRNRLAYSILQVGDSCNDSSTVDFNVSASASEEEKETTSIFMDQVRNALLRASQVQEWIIAEKNNRIVNLEQQLSQSIQENERLRQGDNTTERKTKDSKMIAPPRLPVRQSSSKPQLTNALVPQRMPSRRLTNEVKHNTKLHFKGHHKNNPPLLPQRQASREKQLRKEISDLTTSFRTETASDSSTDRIAQILMDTNAKKSLHHPSSNDLEFADHRRFEYLRSGTSSIQNAIRKNSMSPISKNVSFNTSDYTFQEEISTSKDIKIDASAVFHEKNSNNAISHSRKNQEKNESKKEILLQDHSMKCRHIPLPSNDNIDAGQGIRFDTNAKEKREGKSLFKCGNGNVMSTKEIS
ncbi:MAG: hypothetical protein ACI90V_004010 [Bacillariaceae sp.]|jgi:hypothetical protein